MGTFRYLSLPDVLHCKGGGKSSLYAEMKDGRFPKPIKLGPRRIGWPEHEIEALLQF